MFSSVGSGGFASGPQDLTGTQMFETVLRESIPEEFGAGSANSAQFHNCVLRVVALVQNYATVHCRFVRLMV